MPIYKQESHFGDFNSQHKQAPLDNFLQIDLNHKIIFFNSTKTEKQYRGNKSEKNLTRMINIRIDC